MFTELAEYQQKATKEQNTNERVHQAHASAILGGATAALSTSSDLLGLGVPVFSTNTNPFTDALPLTTPVTHLGSGAVNRIALRYTFCIPPRAEILMKEKDGMRERLVEMETEGLISQIRVVESLDQPPC